MKYLQEFIINNMWLSYWLFASFFCYIINLVAVWIIVHKFSTVLYKVSLKLYLKYILNFNTLCVCLIPIVNIIATFVILIFFNTYKLFLMGDILKHFTDKIKNTNKESCDINEA